MIKFIRSLSFGACSVNVRKGSPFRPAQNMICERLRLERMV